MPILAAPSGFKHRLNEFANIILMIFVGPIFSIAFANIHILSSNISLQPTEFHDVFIFLYARSLHGYAGWMILACVTALAINAANNFIPSLNWRLVAAFPIGLFVATIWPLNMVIFFVPGRLEILQLAVFNGLSAIACAVIHRMWVRFIGD